MEKGHRAAIAVGIRIKNILSHVLCFTLNISDLGFTKFTIIVLISVGRNKLGIKILNPFLSCPGVWGQNIAPSPPHHLCGVGRGKIVIPRFCGCYQFEGI